MKPLFSLLTAIRMIYPLNNRATVIIPAIILAITTICRAQIQEPPKPKTPNTQIKDPIPVSSNDILNAKKVSVNVPRLVRGKDLRVVIDNVIDNSTNSANQYTVKYTLINSGTEDIDITGVAMQGKFSTGQAAGGTTFGAQFIASVLNGDPILRAGESLQAGILATGYELYTNSGPYKYILTADATNKIAEANENNNSAEVQVTAHIPPPAAPDPALKPDLIIASLSVNYTDMLNISYTIKNIGQGAVDLKRASVSGTIEKPNNIYVSGGCGFPAYMLLAPKSLAPGESYSSSFPCSSDLISGQQYVYILTVGSTYEVPESNTTNNTASVQFTKP